MFKVEKLKNVKNEEVEISFVNHAVHDLINNINESYKTLSFLIKGSINDDNYSLSFDLNCKLEDLLKIESSTPINFNKYIFSSETYFTVNNITDIFPKIEITANRYMKNKFVLLIYFSTELEVYDDPYVGIIEFSFNLDDYI